VSLATDVPRLLRAWLRPRDPGDHWRLVYIDDPGRVTGSTHARGRWGSCHRSRCIIVFRCMSTCDHIVEEVLMADTCNCPGCSGDCCPCSCCE